MTATPTIVCFWTGTTPMTPARAAALAALDTRAGVPVRCVRAADVASLLVDTYPLHPAYPYLSETHKADYLRAYVMHTRGGGYSDIKAPTGSWVAAFKEFAKRPGVYVSGYRESGPDCVANANADLKPHWHHLLGNGAYIVRPRTPFTQAWFDRLHAVLDRHLDALRAHPATHPRDHLFEGTGYPLEWSELLGQIFHPLCYEFREHLRYDVPIPDCRTYR
jgi:hypothetical protein